VLVARRFTAGVIAIAITSLSISASPAHADVKPTPSPTSTLSPAAQYVEALQQYKIDMKLYLEAKSLREQQLRSILIDFNRALKRASDESRAAGRGAVSKAAFAAARAAAATARDEAVALLGPEPEPPIAPIKPMKGAKSFAPSQKPGKKN
jgi:hypothetical protein